ncbi:bifunctional helix-turn-helix transcriptional regulator/GNAT family N-acetyltransferase [Phenylobacterium montanum]|uniref:MarR family transcriptional regulator n=1 Tax=Phenylobacterium montanum TaxID=2823693 RepID=A0A975FWY4_9CAUL|nr:helix-turn-helix domain-containing GNAT family N-acetyltransferase [Caulobacter sp. S6]QUD86779.1 MarR family transcriptional regulator [Caulobacter sp. S6]
MSTAVDSIRSFNRFFTKYVGALDPRFLGTDLSLSEARLLYEIAHADGLLALDLQGGLDMDPAYVSRVLKRFEDRGWITRGRGEGDARQRPIALTAAGRTVFDDMDARQCAEVAATLDRLGPAQQGELVAALACAKALLDDKAQRQFSLRTFRAGDMGLIAARQSILYREVYGWGPQIEVIEGEVTTNFLRDFKPGREQCWVAEVDGVMAGSIFVTDEGEGLCRLRLLYVEPFARGLGIGEALVATCIDFARQVGYREMTLWTHTILESARRIYAAHGFRIVETHVHEEFGAPVQSETWRLDLTGG